MMPRMIATKLTEVLEKVFADLDENICDAARNCRNSDASTALGEVSGAIGMMDIPWIVREVLEIPHDSDEQGSAL